MFSTQKVFWEIYFHLYDIKSKLFITLYIVYKLIMVFNKTDLDISSQLNCFFSNLDNRSDVELQG